MTMTNVGPGKNDTQFFICTTKTKWLDDKHVVFGQVVEDYNVFKVVENVGSGFRRTSSPVNKARHSRVGRVFAGNGKLRKRKGGSRSTLDSNSPGQQFKREVRLPPYSRARITELAGYACTSRELAG
ncbi:Peptidyl-prolyl cis-trans isomerase CYP19-1 [Striga hermonthica]|uniref:Peptidyl-prolyl cis-trans isomerase n=1 Tax=Striga hermonthica TaxID=68872 RepID=A0A9N7N0L9_STRHE|nr:Peptidyl-prolyl cis-trans isomerase CYP19-1 [Striga hermonthica]